MSFLRSTLRAYFQDAQEWCAGRIGWWRAVILLYLIYAGLQHLKDPLYSSWFGGITFGIHELGHLVLGFDGQFLAVAGGSLCQLAAPLAAVFVFLGQRDYFGITVAGAWLAFSLFNLATYVGDARAMELPLLGLSDEPLHDWNYLLTTLNLVRLDRFLAFVSRALAFLIWLTSMVFGGYLCTKMFRNLGAGRGVRLN